MESFMMQKYMQSWAHNAAKHINERRVSDSQQFTRLFVY